MRIDGSLAKWNDERGFGFIAPAQGGSEIFVHVSTFPRDGQRPRVGERLSFEIETDKNGKKRATNLVCLDRQVQHATRQHTPSYRRENRSVFRRIVQLAFVVALIAYGYVEYSRRATPRSVVAAQSIEHTTSAVFQCDGRTLCSQMTSCAEATFFLQNCPNVKMDGNHDGVPCEQQWCNK
jgi:cold shock CspA family protein